MFVISLKKQTYRKNQETLPTLILLRFIISQSRLQVDEWINQICLAESSNVGGQIFAVRRRWIEQGGG